jgi:hypothetical protein
VNYQELLEMSRTRKRKLANNTYLVVNDDGSFGVRLHSTQVLVFHPDGRVVLNSGGWQTPTTKERMNTFGLQGIYHPERGEWVGRVSVWQQSRRWYVTTPTGTFEYADGLTVFPDGSTDGEVADPDADARARRRELRAERARQPMRNPWGVHAARETDAELRERLRRETPDFAEPLAPASDKVPTLRWHS